MTVYHQAALSAAIDIGRLGLMPLQVVGHHHGSPGIAPAPGGRPAPQVPRHDPLTLPVIELDPKGRDRHRSGPQYGLVLFHHQNS